MYVYKWIIIKYENRLIIDTRIDIRLRALCIRPYRFSSIIDLRNNYALSRIINNVIECNLFNFHQFFNFNIYHCIRNRMYTNILLKHNIYIGFCVFFLFFSNYSCKYYEKSYTRCTGFDLNNRSLI
jgi:hypothetical protein